VEYWRDERAAILDLRWFSNDHASAPRPFARDVRAAFTLADGSKMQGYLTPAVRGNAGLGMLQPIIVTERGQVMFWCGLLAPDAQSLAQRYEMLGRDAARVFPLQVTSDVELVGGPVRATVPGLIVLADFRTGRTRIVT
jgi:hypothetical protein